MVFVSHLRSSIAASILIATAPAVVSNDFVISESQIAAGGQIYATQCAGCHGENGLGEQGYYADPLMGDSSIGELAELIADTMPEEDPDACVADDALAVAAYIHQAFYSEAAQVRNRPPRRALQRLTGSQLRQSLADLYARFVGTADSSWNQAQEKTGLRGLYYDGMKWGDEDLKINRIDPRVDFDFGLDGPGEGIGGEEFHAFWEGGLRAPETGRYEIVVRSGTSFIMWLGHNDAELIDNHVQSGGLSEFRRFITLTAGRSYPIKIDLKQRKRKTETPPANVSLSWVRPGGIEQIIAPEFLTPDWTPPSLRLDTRMPPDDSSYGFQRGISVDAAWDEAVTSAAIEFADAAIHELWPGYQHRHRKDNSDRREKLLGFLTELVAVAHRGTVEQTGADQLAKACLNASDDDAEVIKRGVLWTIKSPRFLYPTLDADRSVSQAVANRISLTLHDSLPVDNQLTQSVAKGQLNHPNRIRQMVTRLADDARTRAKMRELLHHWLDLSPGDDLAKNAEQFPGFDATVTSDLRDSLDRFLDDVIWGDASDYRQLVAADWAYTTDRLAAFYGDAWQPLDADDHDALRPSVRDAKIHVGVLAHPLVMAKFAHHDASSPIHRGVFLIRQVMGRTLRPPNEAFAPLSPDLRPDLTTRGRVALQTSPDSCQICHSKINPLGFALEQFDAAGRFRLTDREQPIDATGFYVARDGQTISFDGARQLADFVITSPDAHRAFVSRVFQYFTKQPVAAYGADRLDQLTRQFQDNDFNVRQLIIDVTMVVAEDTLEHHSMTLTSTGPSS